MVNPFAFLHHPRRNLIDRTPFIAQVCRAIDQQAVPGRAAQRVDHNELLLRILLAQLLGCLKRICNRICHAGAKSDMQYIAALLQEVVEKRKILKHVQLRRSWDLSFFEKGIELRARFGVAPHIILILYPVYRIRIKQHGNVSLFRIGIRKINGRFARKCKRHHTMLLLLLCGKDAPC